MIGGRGYVGQEILDLLSCHDRISVTSVFSSSQAGELIKGYTKDSSLRYRDLSGETIDLGSEDAYILALPNNEASKYVEIILNHNPKAIIIDLSSDHRFDNSWQYRIPELSGPVSSSKISNPGCYATAMQLMLAPLKDQISGSVNFFGVSGFSGAGASPNPRNNTQLLEGNILAYSLIGHLHEQEVQQHSYKEILFTPHVGDFFRGIHMTGNFTLKDQTSAMNTLSNFSDFYDGKSLIRVQQHIPHLQQVRNTSQAIIGGFVIDEQTKRLTFCCVIDNLLKGAATQALQNLNSAFDWEDNLGIKEL